jgi:uncharacterized protein
MKKLLCILAVVLISNISIAQDSDYKKDVLKYLELSGQSLTVRTVLKEITKNIPEAKKAAFTIEMESSVTVLMGKMADLYMTEFSQEEVKSLLAFYATPIGKKLAEKTPVISEKGQIIGKEWGQGLQSVMMKYMN